MMNNHTYRLRGFLSSDGYYALSGVFCKCATLYNAALEERILAYKWAGKSISYYDQQAQMRDVCKEDYSWSSLHTRVARGVLLRLDRSFQAFFNRVKRGEAPGFPRFKPASRFKTIAIDDSVSPMLKRRGKWGFVKVKGLPTIRFKWRNDLPDSTDHLKSIRITKTSVGLDISLTYAFEPEVLVESNRTIGIDLGVADRLTLSNGQVIESRKPDDSRKKRLQQEVGYCKMGSKTRRKRVEKLSRECYHNKIRNRSMVHELTSGLIKQFGTIVIEDLDIKKMVESGNKQKSNLNRRILDQTWGILRSQLRYKAEWAGRKLVEVKPHFTSQKCSQCGDVSSENRNGKLYKCKTCGNHMDADLNAARNILRAGWEFPGGLVPER